MKGRILIVDDDRDFCEMIVSQLERRGFRPAWRVSAEEALLLLDFERFDVVFTDLHLEDMNGLDLCQRILGKTPDVPVVVMTAFGSLETAIGAIRAGAYDFITKPCNMEELVLTAERAIRHFALEKEVRRLQETIERSRGSGEIIGESPVMRKVYDLIERVADSEAAVLVCGESGTGKELVARSLHQKSMRRNGPFVALNCAAVPATLLESELFGHVKGAFTDAKVANNGLFQQATGGVLFLDEIGEMPVEMQAKLLRALQERRVRPVGSVEEVAFDARILSATNRDLEEAVEKGTFREDLFYRINVVSIEVPPLRSRGNDILLLAQHFLERSAQRNNRNVVGISGPAAGMLLEYDWPGNVRELENCVERAVALTRFEQIVVEDLPEKVRQYRPQNFSVPTNNPSELLSMEEVERRYIAQVLKAVGGNKSAAARVLGFDRRTLYRKLEKDT